MNVFLSKTAYDQLHQIIAYLEEKWPEKVRDNFLDKLQRSMDVISRMPKAFPSSHTFPGIRKCVITPQTTAYYRIDEARNEVEIIAVIDSRKDVGY